MYLLLDIGNTRCKAALYTKSTLTLISDLDGLINNYSAIKKVIVSCVGSDAQLKQIKKQLYFLDMPWLQVQSEKKAFGLLNSYSEPEKLGVDRWLAMLAAKQQFDNQDLLIIDAGTAVTIDWLDQQGNHQGGWILPSITLQQQAVVSNTAKVVKANDSNAKLLPANTTINALQNGCLAAVVGAIHMAWRTKPVHKIILTGGDSNLLTEHLAQLPLVIEPLLVFKGLSRYC